MKTMNQIKGRLFQASLWLQDPNHVRYTSLLLSTGIIFAAAIGLMQPCGPMPGGSDGPISIR
jgi:hypothetical protein